MKVASVNVGIDTLVKSGPGRFFGFTFNASAGGGRAANIYDGTDVTGTIIAQGQTDSGFFDNEMILAPDYIPFTNGLYVQTSASTANAIVFYDDGNSKASGERLEVTRMTSGGIVKAGPGRLKGLCVIGGAAQGTHILYNNTTSSGQVLARGVTVGTNKFFFWDAIPDFIDFNNLFLDLSGVGAIAFVLHA